MITSKLTLLHGFGTFFSKNYKNSLHFRGQMESSVWEEKHYNPRLTKSLEEFTKIMDNLNLPYPKKIGKFITIQYGNK